MSDEYKPDYHINEYDRAGGWVRSITFGWDSEEGWIPFLKNGTDADDIIIDLPPGIGPLNNTNGAVIIEILEEEDDGSDEAVLEAATEAGLRLQAPPSGRSGNGRGESGTGRGGNGSSQRETSLAVAQEAPEAASLAEKVAIVGVVVLVSSLAYAVFNKGSKKT